MASRFTFLLTLIVSAICLASLVAGNCYNPDGSMITDPAYQPCNQVTGTISQCCGTNHTGGVIAPDICLPNGLCQNTGDKLHWRGSCTDPTFKSPFCLQRCINSTDGGDSTENVPVQLCSDGSWCCRDKNCCGGPKAFRLAATLGLSSTTTTSTQSSTISTQSQTSTNPPETSNTANSSSSSSSNDGLSSGAKIGIGVGVTGGVLAIGALVGIFVCLRRRDMRRFEALTAQNQQYATYPQEGFKDNPVPQEMTAYSKPVEASEGRPKPSELP